MNKYIQPVGGRYAEIAKLIISLIYLLVPLGLLIFQYITSGQADHVVMFLVVIFIMASAYVIYGEKIIDRAKEDAGDIIGEKSSEEDK